MRANGIRQLDRARLTRSSADQRLGWAASTAAAWLATLSALMRDGIVDRRAALVDVASSLARCGVRCADGVDLMMRQGDRDSRLSVYAMLMRAPAPHRAQLEDRLLAASGDR